MTNDATSTFPGPPYHGGVWSPQAASVGQPQPLVVDVVIPALNEEQSLGQVLQALPWERLRKVVVVDNGSEDATAEVARAGGAVVVPQPQRGYGKACLTGLEALRQDPPDVVVFLDADFSDHPQELGRVIAPIEQDEVHMVIGSRTIGMRERGALLPQAVFGNRLACSLIDVLYGYRFTDLGPFRAMRWDALESLGMRDEDFGWTVEMQVKAAQAGLSCVEVPVSYRKRVGVSKITGTIQGTVRAGHKILYTIFAQYLLDQASS